VFDYESKCAGYLKRIFTSWGEDGEDLFSKFIERYKS
jgi:hypothetical protein